MSSFHIDLWEHCSHAMFYLHISLIKVEVICIEGTPGPPPGFHFSLHLIPCKRFRGDVTVKRNSQLESCLLESDGDTEDEEDSDGKLTHFLFENARRLLKGRHV